MNTRRRIPRSIVGAWGIQTDAGPFCDEFGIPRLYTDKKDAQ